MSPSDAGAVAAAGALALSLSAAVWDYRTGRIPNGLTHTALLAVPAASLVYHAARGGLSEGLAACGGALLGALVCGAFPLYLFARRGLGGGDVKLFAGIGALLGWRAGLDAECLAFLGAALFVLARFAWRGKLGAVAGAMLGRIVPALRRRPELDAELRSTLRLGPAIFAGTFAALVVRALTARGGA
jgi:prepilin peptidase CpaA